MIPNVYSEYSEHYFRDRQRVISKSTYPIAWYYYNLLPSQWLAIWRIFRRTTHSRDLDAIKMNSMKTIPTQVFLVNVLLWSVFFFFINEILVLHSSLAALKEKIADGFTFKIIVYILGGFLMAYISRYIKRRENTP